jgi:type II secretory pathway pseudopilin PulG
MLKLKTNRNRSAGDTLIEVLFAVTVFSLIVVTSLSLMNQGVSAAQRSLEITTVRQQMDGQVETLRFLHEAYVQAYQAGQTYNLDDATTASPAKEYYKIIKYTTGLGSIPSKRASASSFGGTTACQVPNNRSTDFILNPVSATLVTDPNIFKPAETFSQLSYGTGSNSGILTGSNGMWIEAVRSGGAGASSGFIDFHVRACWDAPGLNSPMNLGTIVRLYEPLS